MTYETVRQERPRSVALRLQQVKSGDHKGVAAKKRGARLGLCDRLVALEALLDTVGHRPKIALRPAYTSAWHRKWVAKIVLEEGIHPA